MSAGGVPARDALDSAAIAIRAGGSATARLDAELLLADVLGVDRSRLLIDDDLRVAGPAVRRFQDVVRRRAIDHEPVAYLLGLRGFRHLDLAVDERVLVPRPETELLVEVGLELPIGSRVLDVGTGSGAVALALKHERPDLAVTGSDVSADALSVARANAERLGLDVALVEADLLPEGRFDAVLSNPPYVAEGAHLPADVLREPRAALFAGPDGLAVLRPLIAGAGARGAGLLAVEVGAGQAETVAALVRDAGYAQVRTRRDLAGIERVVVGSAPSAVGRGLR